MPIEPLSIVTAAASLIGTCTRIYTFINNTRNVDIVLRALGDEIKSLSRVLNSMAQMFNHPTLANITLRTGLEARHWRNVIRLLVDCRSTLEHLEDVLKNIRRPDLFRFLGRLGRQIRLDTQSVNIAVLNQQIRSYREIMQVSLQLLSM